MYKKSYSLFFLIGTFLVFSFLPLFNYSIDRWRILHSDYIYHYAGETPNKTFLKTKYLVEHPMQYNTLLMGSSNGGYIDATRISKGTYNMKYNFGLLAIHLKNLKVLLRNNMKIKKIWVGINDYIIWKNPLDYYNSFERRPYYDNWYEDLKTYAFYLFREPDLKDFALWRNQYRLIKTDIITHPQPHLEAKKREAAHLKNPKKWKKHISGLGPSLLRYNDSTYRINEAIEEIKSFKNLCQKNNIDLTFFIYPAFYKTYLAYNQKKIEEFKYKLAQVTPYYDFYRLDDNAYDALKWQDSMHFSYSRGNDIINNIQKRQNLVNQNNVHKHLQDIRIEALEHIALQKDTFILHPTIIEHNTSIIYDFLTDVNRYNKSNEQFKMIKNDNKVDIYIHGKDPILLLPPVQTNEKKVFFTLNIYSPHKTIFKLYYKNKKNDHYSESNIFRKTLYKGINTFCIALPAQYVKNILRVNLAYKQGHYIVNKMFISKLSLVK